MSWTTPTQQMILNADRLRAVVADHLVDGTEFDRLATIALLLGMLIGDLAQPSDPAVPIISSVPLIRSGADFAQKRARHLSSCRRH